MTKEFYFTPESLYNLLIHYSDGAVPLNGQVTDFLVHPTMRRKIGLLVLSEEWETKEPLFVGYDGKKFMSWSKSSGKDVVWEERAETPTHTAGGLVGRG